MKASGVYLVKTNDKYFDPLIPILFGVLLWISLDKFNSTIVSLLSKALNKYLLPLSLILFDIKFKTIKPLHSLR